MMKVLVTGAAGFIGMHASLRLLERADSVIGIDNLNDYYDPTLKQARLEKLNTSPSFTFVRADVADRHSMERIFLDHQPQRVVHLAAQAGVRYSLTNPHAYIDSNLQGFVNILEGCRHAKVEHLVYASSSSVYGGNTSLPFKETDSVDHPISLYAATKKANELMAHTYSHLFRLPTTGLRFFTVYGPWGRPDMALFLFTKAILEGRPIDVFNHGKMRRDFTYVDDIVEGILRVLDRPAEPDPAFSPMQPDPARSDAPYRIFNIGNSSPVQLMTYIETLEENLGRNAVKNFLPLQQGDVPASDADTSQLKSATGFAPATPVKDGIRRFVEWYRSYYSK
jgi:UDP-glucuronate 4-epimerase